MKHLNYRFLVQEVTVFSTMNLKNVYPDEVVLKKFELFERQFSFVSPFTDPEAAGRSFLRGYKKIRALYDSLTLTGPSVSHK